MSGDPPGLSRPFDTYPFPSLLVLTVEPVGHLMHIAVGGFVGYNAAKLRVYVDGQVEGAREELIKRRSASA